MRIYEVGCVERRTARLALVTVSAVAATVGASAHHIPVGEEFSGLLVVGLHGCLLLELSVVVQVAEKLARRLSVDVGSGSGVYVERNAEFGHRVLDDVVVAIHNVLRSNAFLTGFDGDRHTMFVASADHDDVATLSTEIACIDVGRDVNTCEVADMDGSVSIRESRRYESAFEILFHCSQKSS